jgi:hypothetical protein
VPGHLGVLGADTWGVIEDEQASEDDGEENGKSRDPTHGNLLSLVVIVPGRGMTGRASSHRAGRPVNVRAPRMVGPGDLNADQIERGIFVFVAAVIVWQPADAERLVGDLQSGKLTAC